MTRTGSIRPLALALALLLSVAPALHAGDLAAVKRSLARAFQEGSAREIHRALASGKKVYLAVPAVRDREGYYGSDQVFFSFEGFFESHHTRLFEVVEAEVEPGGDTALVRARWRYETRGGDTRSELVVFTLGLEDDRWVVTEIRSDRS